MDIEQTLDVKKENWLDLITVYLGTIMFGLLIIIVSIQVLIRVFNLPVTALWTEPVSRYLFIAGTFIGAAVASRNNEHIKLTLIVDRLLAEEGLARRAIDIVVFIVVVSFLIVAVYGTGRAAIDNWNTRALGGVVTITTGYIYSVMAFGFIAMVIYEVQTRWSGITGPGSETSDLEATSESTNKGEP